MNKINSAKRPSSGGVCAVAGNGPYVTVNDGNISRHTLELLRGGDHAAYREVYLHFRNPLFGFINVLTGSRELASEITQQVLMTMWEKRGRIDPDKGIKAYLYTIARNAVMKHFDHLKVVDRYVQARMSSGGAADSPDQIIIGREIELLSEIAVSKMPKTQRLVFELSRQGLTNGEIADRLGINKTSVASQLSKARRELREILSMLIAFFIA